MTKEELEKEAIKASDKKCVKGCSKYYRYGFQDGYIAGAEPREKQIQIDAEQIRALQKQNGELTDKVKELEEKVNGVEFINKRLNEQFIQKDERCLELEAELSKLKPYRCKNHYAVSEKETSNAVLCYRVQNCESCGHFKE